MPECFELNRLPMRVPLVPYPDGTAACAGGASRWQLPLDGRWKFRLVDAPDRAPAGFADADYDDRRWREIDVPGNWTTQGYDRPHYTNVIMPFGLDPPSVPAANPTGLYRTRFALPADWRGRRTIRSCVVEMAQCCTCGNFNLTRGEKIFHLAGLACVPV